MSVYEFIAVTQYNIFGVQKYRDTTRKIRQIGEYCIKKRMAALENKEEVPHDLLTLILQTVGELVLQCLSVQQLVFSCGQVH